MKKRQLLGLSLAALLLAACSDDNNQASGGETVPVTPTESEVVAYAAAIVTTDPTYAGGAVQLANVNYEQGHAVLSPEVISQTKSDFAVSAFGDHFYHIGRFQINSLYKYAFKEPSTQLLGEPDKGFDLLGQDSDANAYQIAFVSETKGYLIRYGSTKVWIVNPSATTESEFKIGELDLSAYDDGDGVPEMNAAKIVGDKLFITMQRLKNWCPEEPDAYMAVFNTKTDTEIDINSANDANGLKGIKLSVRNPLTLDYQKDIGLVVAGVGAGTIFSCTPANRYSGGIEVVNPSTYQTTLLIDDGDEANHPYDFISAARVLDKNNGYFVSYVNWGKTKLYHFNPSTGQVSGVVKGFEDEANIDIRVLAKAPDNTVWAGTAQDLSGAGKSPEIYVINAQKELVTKFSLERDASFIDFVVNKRAVKGNTEVVTVQPPFAPAAGQPDTTAIDANDTAIVAWATDFENYIEGTDLIDSWKDANRALGFAGNSDGSNKGHTTDIVSLGRGGEITLTFDKPITNGEGYDFAVFENSFSDTFLELAWVEVSSDGVNFFRFPNYSFTQAPVGGFGSVNPTNIKGLAGKYKGGFGTPFDLEELKNKQGLDVNAITHVKIVDIVGDGAALDSLGQVIYDPYPTAQSAGFDLDAIGVMHQAN